MFQVCKFSKVQKYFPGLSQTQNLTTIYILVLTSLVCNSKVFEIHYYAAAIFDQLLVFQTSNDF